MPAMAAYIAVPDCQELDTHAMLTSKAADTWPRVNTDPGGPGVTLATRSITTLSRILRSLLSAWSASSSVTRQCVQSGQTSPVPLWLLLSASSAVVVVVLLSGPGPVLLNAKDESEWGRHGAARTSSWSRCEPWARMDWSAPGTCLT